MFTESASISIEAVPVALRADRERANAADTCVATVVEVSPQWLSIVIPALNEEDSIGSTIQRCLDAREHICRTGNVRDVEIIVVSDGSTDRTADIAQEFAAREPTINVIVFPKNRGYGAALKEGFRRSTGEFVAFLDADGTCDPLYFGPMCRTIQEQDAAVVLGSRMDPRNRMPQLRRVGNRFYAFLLGFLSGQAVSDTASGMRVIRRDSLRQLYPLPDGLHFTPAMSARAIMGDLRIVEIPMDYAERVGESKLSVLKDGVRFLLAIGEALLVYRASRLFALAAGLCFVGAWFWGLFPLEFYLRNRRLEEWMIYRLLFSGYLFICSFILVAARVLADQMLSLVFKRPRETFVERLARGLFAWKYLMSAAFGGCFVAIVLVWPGIVEYVRTSHVSLHWSRVIVAVFLLQLAVVAAINAVLQKVVELWKVQINHAAGAGRPC